MSFKSRYFKKGIRLKPTTDETNLANGDLLVNLSDAKFKAYLNGELKEVLTNNQTQTVSNKSIDATTNPITNLSVSNLASGVLDTDLTTVSVADDTLPSAKAVKTYVDARVATKDEAIEISSVPSGNLSATNVQAALNELQSDIDTRALNSDLSTHAASITTHGATGAIMGTTNAQVVTNKSLVDSSTVIVDSTDNTKQIKFDAAGTTATSTTLLSSQTTSRTITLPDVNGTVITSGDTGTVTSSMILDGTIVNADINASAAVAYSKLNLSNSIVNADINASASIADTKLATISTAGKVANSATTATNLNAATMIVARDASGNFSAGTITANLNGTASNVTTNANLTGPITSVGNATSIASQTGTGSTFVMSNSPTITTPVISTITNTGTLTLPTSTDTLVGRATTDTLTNKSLVDSSVNIVDVTDNTKKISFNAGGTTATSTTITAAQTANRVVTLPDATDTLVGKATTDTLTNKTLTAPIISSISNTGTLTLPTTTDTLVGRATTDTLTNKSLSDSTTTIVDVTDATKQIKFDAAGSTSTSTTITSSQTANRTITLPDVTGTIITNADTGTVTSTMILDGTILNADINASAAIARSKLATGTNNTFVANNGSGVLSDVSGITAGTNSITLNNTTHLEIQEATDSSTTGSNASLTAFTGGAIRLTNASLTSLANIPAGVNGQKLTITNRTGNSINVIDDASAIGTAANRIFTGTATTLALANNACLFFKYDATSARWQIIGGAGGSGGSSTTAVDATFNINNNTDATKQINFSAGGASTTTKTTIAVAQTANRTVTLPDATTTLAGIDTTQTLTNKTIVAANNTITTAASGNLTATSLNTALSNLQLDIDKNRNFNRITYTDMAEGFATWSTGNNATVLGGGTINGAIGNESTNPLQGTQSLWYTPLSSPSSSVNDYFIAPAKAVDTMFRGKQAFLSVTYSIDAATTFKVIVYDATNSTVLTTSTDTISQTSSTALGGQTTTTIPVMIPSTCASVRMGFQTVSYTAGTHCYFDSISLGLDAYGVTNVANITDWTSYTPTFTGFGTVTSIECQYRRMGSNYEIRGKFTSGTSTATEARISLPNGATSAGTSVIPSIQQFGVMAKSNFTATYFTVLSEPSVTYVTLGAQNASLAGLTKQNGNALATSGETFSFLASVPILGLDSYNTNIVTPLTQVSSDTMSFVFQSTALTGNEAIGTFNTYTVAANTNTYTIATSAPTQTTSSMSTNGVQVFTRAYNAASTSASPVRVDILIGKGLKSKQVDAYGGLAKTLPFSYDLVWASANTNGATVTYNELTGILSIDSSFDARGSGTSRSIDNFTLYTSGYFVINASKSPALASLPVLQLKVAYLSEQQANGTQGGSSVATTWTTRTLNTLVDSFGIVTSLTSNQFTLPAGTYRITGSTQIFNSNSCKARIQNITDSTTTVIGMSLYNTSGMAASTITLDGEVTITSPKTFALQYYVQSPAATNGLGVAMGAGISELYSQISVLKIK